ncbi:DEAD/DEAH box helicase [Pseudoclavibacter chungangensis]|uniref:DEAD/DEAH box helicase n=1 Tax=Pseudoclavibacter chungangensis TaxID=587635 RepID=A0A7J5BZU4_9MICO|nr:DEAD/DEAH box helicase [Pseudoclavibacter chungangensis]KAB1660175.1 DEAD/DEAH box helicase [Pseudoclavibacter chungangensis]NYJ66712.1 ATP-dependent RNA helicase HelY [Pseudoclavibacter chungangensis]
MTVSPADRFAAARARSGHMQLTRFREELSFDLDPFQIAACERLEAGSSVLVAAPTGAGKTVVAEFAVYLAMREPNAKIFYTTPIKALSNQKFQELVRHYGASEVGLLTGDTNVNPRARIVVMTTEVLRNMLYASSDLLDDLAFVVMDEVHYLADRFRGAVWEEVIIHLPTEVRLVSLSATVSNAEEFGDWLQAVRGDTEVVVSEERPTPLNQHVLVGSRLYELFATNGDERTDKVNPELLRATQAKGRGAPGRSRGNSWKDRRFAPERLSRAGIVDLLHEDDMLPAISFIFSRAGCDSAVEQVLRSGISLTTAEEREEIRWIVEERCRTLLDEDLAILGYWGWLDGLERGVAAHHAGLLPAFKEVVEELFQRKLVKIVFATETLALGINMPARTVVLERLEKFNGEARVPITPGEYTQLTGRAGRRGIDTEGHAVVQWREGMSPQAIASLASRRTYPLNSSFRPTYNMTVNLLERFGRDRARDVLESSFAQFQADRAVVDLARRAKQQRESLAGYAEAMECHVGDFVEYSRIRRELTDLERKRVPADEPRMHEARERRTARLDELRTQMRHHPCHACPEREQHARWAERYWRLKHDTDAIVRQIEARTGAVAALFDRLTELLLERGYVKRDEDGNLVVGANGRMLARIYGERDLLVAECLRRRVWSKLDAASLAAMAAALVFEPRRDVDEPLEHQLPRGPFREALARTTEIHEDLDALEERHRVPRSPDLALGLAPAMYHWARGRRLEDVLDRAGLAAGDFVRWSKMVLDLLDQIEQVTTGALSETARHAGDLVRRGIVAHSSVGS